MSLLVMRYSLDEFRRIFVDENTFIESIEPIIPKSTRNTPLFDIEVAYLPTMTSMILEYKRNNWQKSKIFESELSLLDRLTRYLLISIDSSVIFIIHIFVASRIIRRFSLNKNRNKLCMCVISLLKKKEIYINKKSITYMYYDRSVGICWNLSISLFVCFSLSFSCGIYICIHLFCTYFSE